MVTSLGSSGAARPKLRRHVTGTDENVLDCLKDSSLNVIVWRRRLPRGLGSTMHSWAAAEPPRFEGTVLDTGWLEQALQSFPRGAARDFLASDLALLTRRFRSLTSRRQLKISFGTVHRDQCRKFHADYQHFRLITTYLGPGTEWLPEDAVNRQALTEPPSCPVTANQLIVSDPSRVQKARTGDVLLLRGHDGVCGAALGAVHRSPPIEQSGAVRVVLVASV